MTTPGDGWVRPAPMDPKQAAARHAEARRRNLEHEARAAAEHLATFGTADSVTVDSVTMPASGWTWQWRSDGYYRIVEPGDQTPPEVDTWSAWEPSCAAQSGQVPPGDSSDPTWWVYHGTARPEQSVHAWLADDTDIDVVRLGWLWIAECVALAQPAFISCDDQVVTFPMRRPNYLTPALYQYQGEAENPRA